MEKYFYKLWYFKFHNANYQHFNDDFHDIEFLLFNKRFRLILKNYEVNIIYKR